MSQNAVIGWVAGIIIVLAIVGVGWFWYANQQSQLAALNQYAGLMGNDAGNTTGTTETNQSSAKLIISFMLQGMNPSVVGVIDNNAHTVTLTVPKETDIKKLIPTIVVSDRATIAPASGAIQDFTNPVGYIVKAEDGTLQAYTVTVVKAQ